MNLWIKRAMLPGVLCLAALAPAALAASEAPPVENVRLPIETYPSGRIKTQLHARLARIPQAGPIRGEGVVAESYDEQGVTQLVVTAVSMAFDRAAGKAESDDRVTAVGQGMRIEGVGFDWDVNEQVVNVRRDARVEFNRAAGLPTGAKRE